MDLCLLGSFLFKFHHSNSLHVLHDLCLCYFCAVALIMLMLIDHLREDPPSPPLAQVSVEALSVYGWNKYSHHQIGMRSFGASVCVCTRSVEAQDTSVTCIIILFSVDRSRLCFKWSCGFVKVMGL